MGKNLYGAMEAGGTKFICEAVSTSGEVLASIHIPTSDPATTLTDVSDFFAEQEKLHGGYKAFGIAGFGPLDLRRGSATFGSLLATPKPGWSHTNLIAPLHERFACPVAIDTDVNAAALAEAQLGAGKGCDLVVYITVGTGIGGGIAYRGSSIIGALHPEMGHIRVLRHEHDHEFAGCCPFHGDCLEGLASGVAIQSRFGAALDTLADKNEATDIIAWYLGQLACNVILLLSPQRIVFGGGVLQQPDILEGIRNTVAKLIKGYAGIGNTDNDLQPLVCAPGLGKRSGIAGALLLAQRIGDNPNNSGKHHADW